MADREKTKMPENSTSNATFPILQTYIDTNNPSSVIVNKIQNKRTCHPSYTGVFSYHPHFPPYCELKMS